MRAVQLVFVVGVTCISSACQKQGSNSQPVVAAAAAPGATDSSTLVRFELGVPMYVAEIQTPSADGTLQLAAFFSRATPAPSQPGNPEVLLGIVEPGTANGWAAPQLIRVTTMRPGSKGEVRVRAEPSAVERLRVGDQIVLYRPAGATAEQLDAVPATVELKRSEAALLAQSKIKLERMAVAMQQFHDTYSFLPPAVMRGPDGKPWHSWRVLVLPYLNQQGLYKEYKWDEPWDGPNNGKLLARMPDVFRDPAASPADSAEVRTHTHYAVVSGPGTAFPSEGLQFDSPFAMLPGNGQRVRISDIKDGTASTLLVGELNVEAKIPWTRPQDLTLADTVAQLGGKSSLATNHKTEQGPAAAVAFCDLSVRLLPRNIKPNTLSSLLGIADGKFVGESELPGILARGIQPQLLLTIDKTSSGVLARLDVQLKASGQAAPAPGKLSLPAPATGAQAIRGTVFMSGIAVPGGLAIVFHSDQVTQRATIQQGGRYSIAVPPDKYQVYFEPEPAGTRFMLHAKFAKADTTPIAVEVRAEGNAELSFEVGR